MEVEFLDIDTRNAWATVYQEIRNVSNNYAHIMRDAKKSENKYLNRYRDVNPYDHTRVKLQRGDQDYINASFVHVPSAERSYILTQGPLPSTIGHFWLMVWEQNSKAILMLNRVIEKNAIKCHQYWPIGRAYGGEEDLTLTDVNLKITFLSQKEESNYILREFVIIDLEGNGSRNILQFHYTTWPDFGVPESPAAFLNFLFAVRDSGALNSDVGPPVVHCSAGIGRSGTFCLVDSCLVLSEKDKDPNSIDIRQQLLQMRHYRMGLIQTPDQLRFSYLAIIAGVKHILSKQESDTVYLNNESILQDMNRKYMLESSNVLPPPLPPRCLRNFEDFSPTSLEHLPELICTESNGDISKTTFLVSEADHVKLENLSASSSSLKDIEDKLLSSEIYSKNTISTDKDSLPEMRKRARQERKEKTAAMIQNIKKKQKESELWEKRRSIIKLSLGLVLIFGIGFFVCKNYSKS